MIINNNSINNNDNNNNMIIIIIIITIIQILKIIIIIIIIMIIISFSVITHWPCNNEDYLTLLLLHRWRRPSGIAVSKLPTEILQFYSKSLDSCSHPTSMPCGEKIYPLNKCRNIHLFFIPLKIENFCHKDIFTRVSNRGHKN